LETFPLNSITVSLPDKQVPVSRDRQVFVGGASDGLLQRGDVITAIQNYDATRIPHRQAEDIIRSAGNTLTMNVRRSVGHRDPEFLFSFCVLSSQ